MAENKPVIMVTGSSGQLGLTLHKLFAGSEAFDWIFLSSEQCDITKEEDLKAVFEKYHPDHCINCAAYTDVRKAEIEIDKAYAINANAVGNLAGYCEQYGCILIHISTDYVFDGCKNTPYTPQDIPNPLNVYGSSKLKGEQEVMSSCSKYYIVRTSWLYSKEFGKNFYRTILNNALEKKSMNIITSQKGTPTNTVNLANFLLKLIEEKSPYGIRHFSDGQEMTWYDFAKIILQEHGLDTALLTPIEFFEGDPVDRPLYSALGA